MRSRRGRNTSRRRNTSTEPSRALKKALRFARRGWPVFPLRGKRPRVATGFHAATTDEDQIREWWRNWPDAGVGIPTGEASRLVVIDLDEGGDKAFARLEQQHGDLPRTRRVETGGGGEHLYFLYPSGDLIRNSAGRIGPGIDVRGEGGYIVAPPSQHPRTGKRYRLIDKSPPAPLPDWLLDLLRDPKRNGKPNNGKRTDDRIPEGSRNASLARLAGAMRRHGSGDDEILGALLEANRLRCLATPRRARDHRW